jgi:hypothetical protein
VGGTRPTALCKLLLAMECLVSVTADIVGHGRSSHASTTHALVYYATHSHSSYGSTAQTGPYSSRAGVLLLLLLLMTMISINVTWLKKLGAGEAGGGGGKTDHGY